jgi:dimethylhistidine N-methyltransferase
MYFDRSLLDKKLAAARFSAVRAKTRELIAGLEPEDTTVQSMPDVSPTKWHLAHTTWYWETFVLKHFVPDYQPFDDDLHYMLNSYYNAEGAQFPRAKRGLLSRPTLKETLEYRTAVNDAVLELLNQGDQLEQWQQLVPFVDLGCHHEEQHQELLVTDIKHVFSCNPARPIFQNPKPMPRTTLEPMRWVSFEEGMASVGHEGTTFAFDCEGPHHRIFLNAFQLASRLITNREYLQFIKDGGYERAELWLSDGWRLIKEEGWRAPLYWIEEEGARKAFTLQGLQNLDPNEPVSHISYFEADAFARWAGARLPREHELEIAMNAFGQEAPGNNLSSGSLKPAPAKWSEHMAQLFGDVWEWTCSPFQPYPGFTPSAGAAGEYNGKFMNNQYVIKGGSCLTPENHVRSTYRNFFFPDSRWQVTGLRLARDITTEIDATVGELVSLRSAGATAGVPAPTQAKIVEVESQRGAVAPQPKPESKAEPEPGPTPKPQPAPDPAPKPELAPKPAPKPVIKAEAQTPPPALSTADQVKAGLKAAKQEPEPKPEPEPEPKPEPEPEKQPETEDKGSSASLLAAIAAELDAEETGGETKPADEVGLAAANTEKEPEKEQEDGTTTSLLAALAAELDDDKDDNGETEITEQKTKEQGGGDRQENKPSAAELALWSDFDDDADELLPKGIAGGDDKEEDLGALAGMGSLSDLGLGEDPLDSGRGRRTKPAEVKSKENIGGLGSLADLGLDDEFGLDLDGDGTNEPEEPEEPANPNQRFADFIDMQPSVESVHDAVINGLSGGPKTLPAKLFYDERGSKLFERICLLDEYYLTRVETDILRKRARTLNGLIAEHVQLVEFGSGSNHKVRILLETVSAFDSYVAIDISPEILRDSADEIATDFPNVAVTALCADFTKRVELPAPTDTGDGGRVGFFPGSTVGNFKPEDAKDFITKASKVLGKGSAFIIGVDLKKDKAVLDAAYNDGHGVTAEFNLNMLRRINRELDADFDLNAFEHLAFYNDVENRIEMHLASRKKQTVTVDGQEFHFNEGETIHTESSYKYSVREFHEIVRDAGTEPVATWEDKDNLFSIHFLKIV